VIVDELQARVRPDRVRGRRADRRLVADPLTLARIAGKVRKGVYPTGQPGTHAAGVDLRDKTHRMQNSLGFQGVVADSVTLDDRGMTWSIRVGLVLKDCPCRQVGAARDAVRRRRRRPAHSVWLECRQN